MSVVKGGGGGSGGGAEVKDLVVYVSQYEPRLALSEE